ncbi:zinc-binding dehydrogenase [Nocardia sp. 004]|uniref:zinc-binding dehydrogenase n=1 Tax=Nocardia sp. 004 TaxID=3385978 RepID=UPI00399F5A75
MRAAVVTAGEFEVTELPTPLPGSGQVLIEVTRCGICGSDLHARTHADEMADLALATGYEHFMRRDQSVVLGHEFSGTVVEYGPDCHKRWKTGTPVVALPIVRQRKQPQLVGLSSAAPGGYAEHVVVQESMTMPIPNGLAGAHAALTEPMAVAWHAVRMGRVGKKRPAFVIGCGPIGLGVISMLRAAGVRTIVASDSSLHRRDLAAACGADIVVDPAITSPWDAVQDKGRPHSLTSILDLGFDAMERLRRLPHLPWWYFFRLMREMNAGPAGPVIFECVGVPGIIDQIITAAPPLSRVVVVGVCMETDHFHPAMAINKEIELRFALGYDPGEFRDTLHMLAEGKIDPAPLITGTVGLDGVANAFTILANPQWHAKILVDPHSSAITPL